MTDSLDTNMLNSDEIVLVSTRTVDHFTDGRGDVPGGPARYIGQALETLGCRYHLITGKTAQVEVESGPDGERYRIPQIPPIPLPPDLRGAAIILSPILSEIDVERVPPVQGLLVVDVQGFVRTPGRYSGSSTSPVNIERLLAMSDVVKVSAAELPLLDAPSRRQLLKKTVLITRGVDGVLVRQGSATREIAANPVNTGITVGAGDTFLAAFVCALIRGIDAFLAAELAARFVEGFLTEREQALPHRPIVERSS